MIDKELLVKTVIEAISGTDLFLVEAKMGSSNDINIEIDSASGVDIDTCARITRRIEEVFDREAEDYSLEVGSAGLTSPFKVRRQYEKNVGNDVEVLTSDGRKLHGVLESVEPGESDTDVAFVVTVPVKVKEPGAKRPVVRMEPQQLSSGACKYVRYDIKF